MEKKVLKTWMGVVSGSLGGRDDGYPESKCHVYDSLENAVSTTNNQEKFYQLVRIPREEVDKARERVRESRQEAEKTSLKRQAARIKKRLKELG